MPKQHRQPTLEHRKSVLAHTFLIAPADRNYLLARFTRSVGLIEEFWWQSLQALEKYFKAALVLNGESAKDYDHNIVRLFDKHIELFGPLAVRVLKKPGGIHDDYWNSPDARRFIERVYLQGHPDSRYGRRSWSNDVEDLFVLDQIFFGVRRLTIGLNLVVGKNLEDIDLNGFYGRTYGDILREMPRYQVRNFKARGARLNRIGDTLEDAWLSWNFAFAPERTGKWPPLPRTVLPNTPWFRNSEAFRIYEAVNRGDHRSDPALAEALQWLLENVRLPSDLKNHIKSSISAP